MKPKVSLFYILDGDEVVSQGYRSKGAATSQINKSLRDHERYMEYHERNNWPPRERPVYTVREDVYAFTDSIKHEHKAKQ